MPLFSPVGLTSLPLVVSPRDITDVELDNLLFVPDFQYSIAHLVQNVGDTFEWLYDCACSSRPFCLLESSR